jgi:hypothetical protein
MYDAIIVGAIAVIAMAEVTRVGKPRQLGRIRTMGRSPSLRSGHWIEVRSLQEILDTLDTHGTLEGVPFMPEMIPYCGKRFEVWKRADKTCDEAAHTIRRLKRTVHLKELRCDGMAHGGCDAGCLFFWREEWLKKVDTKSREETPTSAEVRSNGSIGKCTVLDLVQATRSAPSSEDDPTENFSCQATEISTFSSPLPWWDLMQYVRDLLTRNVTVPEFLAGITTGLLNKIQSCRVSTEIQKLAGANKKTPSCNLNLCPGDLVEIKSSIEIKGTLDAEGRNRGLSFRPGMIRYCAGRYRVLRSVKKIINPSTCKMISLSGNCVILDGAVCTGNMRRFCPRMVYAYWRDIWLTKVADDERDDETW